MHRDVLMSPSSAASVQRKPLCSAVPSLQKQNLRCQLHADMFWTQALAREEHELAEADSRFLVVDGLRVHYKAAPAPDDCTDSGLMQPLFWKLVYVLRHGAEGPLQRATAKQTAGACTPA